MFSSYFYNTQKNDNSKEYLLNFCLDLSTLTKYGKDINTHSALLYTHLAIHAMIKFNFSANAIKI